MTINKKIPVTIITGFLGAGKTTAIIHLLKQKKKNEQWAVLINEFGKVSIDFETLSPKTSANEKVFEISGGCICCSAKDNFRQNLNEIIKQQRFDRILIEPSGLGGADMISEIINDKDKLELMPIVALVSIDYLDLKKLQINPIFRNQILKADILVLSKCDLEADKLKHEEALNKLKNEYPNKIHYAMSSSGKIDLKLITDTACIIKEPGLFDQFIYSGIELQDNNYESRTFSFDEKKCFEIQNVIKVLEKNKSIVRAKGYLKGIEAWHFINYTLGASFVEECNSRTESELVIIFEKEKGIVPEFVLV